MFGLKTKFRNIYNSLYLGKIRLSNQHINLSKGIQKQGLPIFRFPKEAKVSIGENVKFTNHTKFNMVGIAKPCRI